MIRIQLHVTNSQDRRLRALAKTRRTTRAELIREGIELVLRGPSAEHDALLGLVGSAGPAGRGDVSDRHDELLYASEERSPWRPKSS